MKTVTGSIMPALLAGILGTHATPVKAGTYSKDVMLHGAVETTKISGYRGTKFEVQDKNEDHAIYSFMSKERRDQPCYVMVRTENINDHADDAGGGIKDLCGGKATSTQLKVEYSDLGLNEPRVFVRAVVGHQI